LPDEGYQIHTAYIADVILEMILEVYGQKKGSLEDQKKISMEGDYKGDKQKRHLRAEEELIT